MSEAVKRRVIITVTGGVAEVAESPEDVTVQILDYDSYKDFFVCCTCGDVVHDLGEESDEAVEEMRAHLFSHTSAIGATDLTDAQVRDHFVVYQPK